MLAHQTDTLDHPIFNPLTFYIATPMIEQLQTILTQWLWCGATGGYIVGHSRVGKSRAIRKATDNLRTRSGQAIPVFHMDFEARDRSTIASVFRNLCRALDLPLKRHAVADDMSDDIVHRLGEAALANRERYVLLIVDEVQRASVQQLSAFAELYDILVKLQINLFTVFVANVGETDELFKQLASTHHEHIRGRFFINGHYYHGLRHRNEVDACLQHYDSACYPDPDGPTFTEYFLPAVYARGWRLRTLSAPVWRVYQDSFQKPLKLESWGMQYFAAAMKTLLVDYLPAYGVDNNSDIDAMIEKSIDASGLAPSTVMMKQPR